MYASDFVPCSRILRQPDHLPPWEWARQNVSFELNDVYPNATGLTGYDPDLTPFWKEPAEAMIDPGVSEVTVLKPSQAGGTEALVINVIRYLAAVSPCRILYISGDQQAAENDFRERIVGGLNCCATLRPKVAAGRNVECRMELADCVIQSTWPTNSQAFKRNPWAYIFADEFSTYPGLTPGMIRKRCDTVPYSHILWLSSPDPNQRRDSDDDPIFIEWLKGDRRYWMMPDPATGALFRFEMGKRDTPYGLKWDKSAKREDGTWDMQKVRESAHYITPAGTRIENPDRRGVVSRGQWVATNMDCEADRRSYHISAFYMPFKSGDFGQIACAFLEAQSRGPEALRVFVYEYLAEPWQEMRIHPTRDVITARAGKYARGAYISEHDQHKSAFIAKARAVYITVDVQQAHMWWLAREWIAPGDSGLIDFGYCVTWHEVCDLAAKYKADRVGVDIGYAARKGEVETYCSDQNDFMLRGTDSNRAMMTKVVDVPRYPGTYREDKAHPIKLVEFAANQMKDRLWRMIEGPSDFHWWTFEYPPHEYLWQMQAEEKDSGGNWVKKKSRSQNHLWDCENMQLVLARCLGPLEDYTITVEA
jgi:phage terminase large subunit GpA-like protein